MVINLLILMWLLLGYVYLKGIFSSFELLDYLWVEFYKVKIFIFNFDMDEIVGYVVCLVLIIFLFVILVLVIVFV